MKSNLLLFSFFALLLFAGCQDDDAPVSPINQLSRFDGWQVVSAESNLAERVDEAVAALPDSTVQDSGLTREEIRANFEGQIAAETGVEDCERDDVLFFDSGLVVLIQNGADCPENSPPHILTGFDLRQYSTDFSVTRLTLTNGTTSVTTEYEVVDISDRELMLRQSRRVENNLILPPFAYTITYTFRGR